MLRVEWPFSMRHFRLQYIVFGVIMPVVGRFSTGLVVGWFTVCRCWFAVWFRTGNVGLFAFMTTLIDVLWLSSIGWTSLASWSGAIFIAAFIGVVFSVISFTEPLILSCGLRTRICHKSIAAISWGPRFPFAYESSSVQVPSIVLLSTLCTFSALSSISANGLSSVEELWIVAESISLVFA